MARFAIALACCLIAASTEAGGYRSGYRSSCYSGACYNTVAVATPVYTPQTLIEHQQNFYAAGDAARYGMTPATMQAEFQELQRSYARMSSQTQDAMTRYSAALGEGGGVATQGCCNVNVNVAPCPAPNPWPSGPVPNQPPVPGPNPPMPPGNNPPLPPDQPVIPPGPMPEPGGPMPPNTGGPPNLGGGRSLVAETCGKCHGKNSNKQDALDALDLRKWLSCGGKDSDLSRAIAAIDANHMPPSAKRNPLSEDIKAAMRAELFDWNDAHGFKATPPQGHGPAPTPDAERTPGGWKVPVSSLPQNAAPQESGQ